MSSKRKPAGYWDNFENLRSELLEFIHTHSLDAMPTQSMLVENSRNDLCRAITLNGGFFEVAKKCGFKIHNAHKPPKYWNDFENLKIELIEAIKKNGWSGIPIQPELIAAGRSDLVNALRKHGGIYKVAQRLSLGVATDEKPNGYWTLENMRMELNEFISINQLEKMPTITYMQSKGRFDLIHGIDLHGGIYKVAELMNLPRASKNKPKDYWTYENLVAELTAYIDENALTALPLIGDLVRAGRNDLVSAIHKHGGIHHIASKMNLKISSGNKPMNYWTPENLKAELQEFMQEYKFETIPLHLTLIEMGRPDIAAAIQKFGGLNKVAGQLGLELTSTSKPNGYWTIDTLRKELFDFLASINSTTMPIKARFEKENRKDLLGAISKFGGIYEVARIFSLKTDAWHKPKSYWNEENLKAEILSFMEDNNLEIFPTTTMLYSQRKHSIVAAIGNYGGVFKVAEMMELSVTSRKPDGYWTLDNIKSELLEFMVANGFTKMPTKTFFETSGRVDLLGGMSKFGGMVQVAKMLELEMENPYRNPGSWTFETLGEELMKFMEENEIDKMPTMNFIKEAGRGDLEGAIAKFGGILKVCKELGIEINFNPELAFHHESGLSEDGHYCYSRSEKIIDDWLYSHGIEHEKEVRYPYHEKFNQFNYVCDWLCGDLYLEYAGMMNIARYAKSIENKISLANDLELNLVILQPDDMKEMHNKLCDLFGISSDMPRQMPLF